MNEAIVLLILAAIALSVAAVFFGLHLGVKAVEALVAFVQHEMMMRPKERYYRM